MQIRAVLIPLCLLLEIASLTACSSVPVTPAPSLRAAANPLEKEGQSARLQLEIVAAQVTGLKNAPVDAQGFLQAKGAQFSIAGADGQERLSGVAETNTLLVPTAKLGSGPYQLSLTLPTGQVLEAHLQETLKAGETRILRAEQIQVRSVVQDCGDNCTQIGGDVNIEQKDTTVNGSNCVGIGNQCPASD